MKLNNKINVTLLLCTLSFGTQLLGQEVPETTYHAHIASLKQHAAVVTAWHLHEEPYRMRTEAVEGYVPNYLFVNNIEKNLLKNNAAQYANLPEYIQIPEKYSPLDQEKCIAHDDSDALSYYLGQLIGNDKEKNADLLKSCSKSAVRHNAASCFRTIMSHADPKEIIAEDFFEEAIHRDSGKCLSQLLPYSTSGKVYNGEYFEYAVRTGATECVRVLLPYNDPGLLPEPEKHFLDAVKNGHAECVHILLPYNKTEVVYQGFWSPLEQAFRGLEEAQKTLNLLTSQEYSKKVDDYERMLSLLLESIPGIITEKTGESVLSMATKYKAPVSLIKQIIALDNSLINSQHNNHTPLYYAVDKATETKNNEAVELLLAKGANPNLGKERPLFLAVQKLRPELVQLLMQAGATPTKKILITAINQLKKSVSSTQQLAAYENLTMLIPKGKEFFADTTLLAKLISVVSARKKLHTLPLLQHLGMYLCLHEHLTEKGETPLHIALTYKNARMVEALLQVGCNPEATTTDTEETPLHYAAWCEAQSNDTPCMEQLLASGVAPDKADKNGDTALHKAARNNNCRGTFLLLKHGADQDIKNNSNRTAYEVAQSGTKAVFDAFALGKKQAFKSHAYRIVEDN